MTDSTDAGRKLDAVDNSVQQRIAGDFWRSGDGTPYWWDGVTLNKDGSPKLRRAGRASNAGHGLGGDFALERWRQTYQFVGAQIMADEARRMLGHYPELWDTDDRATREVIASLVAEGFERAGGTIDADRGTLLHVILERCGQAVIAGDDPNAVDVADLEPGAAALGLPMELLEHSRALFARLFLEVAEPLACELKIVNPPYNKCGTADLIVRWRVDVCAEVLAGDVTGADLKTGKIAPYNIVGMTAQMAAYFASSSRPYTAGVDATDPGHPAEWPWELERGHAVLLHMPIREALEGGELALRLVVVDLELGTEALELALAVSSFAPTMIVPSTFAPLSSHLSESRLLADLRLSVALAMRERVAEWLHQRVAAIAEFPIAVEHLGRLWPEELPRSILRDHALPDEYVEPIIRLLAFIEGEYHLPFGPTDPRMRLEGSRHQSPATADEATTSSSSTPSPTPTASGASL